MRRKSPSFDSIITTPHLWSGVARSDLERYAEKLCLLYASHPEQDASLRAAFDAMYSRLLEDLSPAERGSIIDEVCASLPVGVAAVQTLALFVYAEPDPGVAATAVINMAHLAPLSGDDPLSGLSMLTSLYEHEHTAERVPVSIFCGLLLLGDRRVLPILDRLWGLLGRQGRHDVLFAKSGFAYASTVDFLLDRLGKERDDGLFGSLAAALCRLPGETAQGRRPGYVVDVARRFPSSFLESEPTLSLLGEWPIEEYGARIAPKLKELARGESEPKVLPTVMAAWRIDQKGHDNMPMVEKFSHDMIENLLKAKGIRYLRDSDGDFYVMFSPSDDVDHELCAWFMAVGRQKDLYRITVYASKRYPKSEWSRCLMLCNTWNREQYWPKAYLNVDDPDTDTSGSICLEGQIDLEEGIHQELFDDFTDTIITSAFAFWRWEQQQGARL